MKEYYASRTKLIILPIIPVFIIFSVYFLFMIDHTKTSQTIASYVLIIVTTIMFSTLAVQHVKRLKQPVLTIQGNKITLVDGFYNRKTFSDIQFIKLIICNDYITFVEAEQQDIFLSKNEFTEGTLATLLTDLELLPFKEIIK